MDRRVTMVPLDGSELADRLVPRLLPLIHRDDDEALLLRVVRAPSELREARAHLDRVQEELDVQMIRASVALRVGEPAAEILWLAADARPQLVAMATRGRSGPARWLLGSVAERVLRHSPVPVLLANPEAVDTAQFQPQHAFGFGRLLLPVDGSRLSHRVLPLAAHVATRYESEVVLLHVADEPDPPDPTAAAGLSATLLEPLAARLRERGRPVTTRVVGGDAAGRILDAAAARDIDCIAMTTHGRSGPARWWLGSVAEKVARAAPCPVLLVRTGAPEPRGGLLDTVL